MTEQTTKYLNIKINKEQPIYVTEFSEKLLLDYYLRKDESVSEAFARASTAYCYGDYQLAQRIYDYIHKGWFMFSSPILSNAPKGEWLLDDQQQEVGKEWVKHKFVGEEVRALPISCYLGFVPDTIRGQIESVQELAWLSITGGGVGLHNNIRAVSDKAPGPIPYEKTIDANIGYFRQGAVRRGSAAYYMDVSHPDIVEHIKFRVVTGGDSARKSDNRKNFHSAVNITHEFELAVKYDFDWELKCPHTGKVYETMKARYLWDLIMETREKTGEPYLNFIDTAQEALCPEQNVAGLRLHGSNICVAPETKILTKNGYKNISTLEGVTLDIWNGEEWSEVLIKKTGTNQKLLKVTTKDGYELECTPEHKFYIRNIVGKKYKGIIEVPAKELKSGDRLIRFDLPIIQGNEVLDFAYANGFYSGDGCEVGEKQRVYFYGEKRNENILSNFSGLFDTYYIQENQNREYGNTKLLRNKFFVPSCDFTIASRLEWLAGILDSDGTVTRNKKSQTLQICSVEHDFLKNTQLMLQTLGVESKVTKNTEACIRSLPLHNEAGEYGDFQCKVSYRLLIGGNSISKLLSLGLKLFRLNLTDHIPNRECSHFIRIDSVVDEGRVDDTYCFTEHKRHMGMFNGILTGQCNEVHLATSEERTAVCCLSSVNLEKYHEWKNSNLIEDLVTFLDNVIQFFIDYAPPEMNKAVFSAKAERSIGIGAMGFSSLLQSKMIDFESMEATALNTEIFATMYHKATKQNKVLGASRGEPADLKGSGKRCAHLFAVAPNANSSLILGISPSIEPWNSNAFAQNTRAGTVIFKNKHLDKILESAYNCIRSDVKSYTEWSKEIWLSIVKNEGSVQHLDCLTEEEKKIFKSAWEIDQHWVVQHAEDRQKYICQGQSLNLFFPAGVDRSYVNSVHMKAMTGRIIKGLYYLRSNSKVKADTVKTTTQESLKSWQEPEVCISCQG